VISYQGTAFHRADGDGAVAYYRQTGDVVWAEVTGGPVLRGALAGTCSADGTLNLAYALVLTTGEVVSGHTVNHPDVESDGRLVMREEWQRYGQHPASGVSYLEEVREPVQIPTAREER
jgi:hypothetical protein